MALPQLAWPMGVQGDVLAVETDSDPLLRRSFHRGRPTAAFLVRGSVCSSLGYRLMSVVSASFWHAVGMSSLEGFECGDADQHERRSDDVSIFP